MSSPSEFLGTVGEVTADLVGRVLGPASIDSIFSHGTDDTGATIITAAAFERAGGFGWGGGSGTGPEGEDGGGAGAGGGGVAEGRPVAVIRIADGHVQVSPVVDVTKIAVTALVGALAVWRVVR